MVRTATVQDAEGIARVHVRSWQQAYAHVFSSERLAELSVEQRAERWRSLLTEATPTFVADVNGEVVGFAGGGLSRDDDGGGVGELYGIYVDPSRWGEGLGRELMAAVEQLLHDSGFDQATLWVLDDNPRARRFYEVGGWSADGTRRGGHHLGVDTIEVRYRKRL